MGRSWRLLVASPAYLEKHGRPERPAELAAHEAIRMSNIAGSDTLHQLARRGFAPAMSARVGLPA